MITKDREYRSFDFTIDEMNVEGTPVVFEKPTLMYEIDGVKFYEVIDREAFDGAKIDDVVLNVDHSGKPAAKTKNGTLDIRVGMNGVHIKADLSKNATGRELFGDIGTSSFYPPHHMTMGEGGAVYTNSPILNKIIRSIS